LLLSCQILPKKKGREERKEKKKKKKKKKKKRCIMKFLGLNALEILFELVVFFSMVSLIE